MGVQPPFDQTAASFGFQERSLGHAWQGGKQGGVHGCDGVAKVFEAKIAVVRFELLAQFVDDFLEALRVKDIDGFGERPQGDARATQLFLHVFQFARLL